MGRRPLSAVRDLTRDGRWSTYDVNVLKKMGGKMRTDRTKGVGPSTTLAWPGWKQPDIPVEVDTARLETSRTGTATKRSITQRLCHLT